MIKSIDIGLYEDGYDISYVDCIHNPIAAAAGCYAKENYFYYAMLHGLVASMEGYDECTTYDVCREVLPVIGINMGSYEITDNKKKTIEIIQNSIANEKPVILIVKYNSLFYSPYYKNPKFTSNHGLIVYAFNSENETVGIKETILLRDTGLLKNNPDVHYSLQITQDSLYDIISNSNQQFNKENSQHCNRIYYLECANNSKEKFTSSVKFILQKLEQCQEELIRYIKDDNCQKIIEEKFKGLNLRFHNSRSVFYDALKRAMGLYSLAVDPVSVVEKEDLEIRRKSLNVLFMNAKRKMQLSEKQKQDFVDELEAVKQKLIKCCEQLSKYKVDNELESIHIDLSDFYNNTAFEDAIRDDSKADITGEGTHYLMENIEKSKVLEKGKYSFVLYPAEDGDNLSCIGQTVELQKAYDACQLDFLFCSEYGSYMEKCKVVYESGEEHEIEIKVSDFFQSAIYDEFLFWSGTALNRKKGTTTKHSFPARLFAKSYKIPEGKIVKIKFPNRKNIHVFALTIRKRKSGTVDPFAMQ